MADCLGKCAVLIFIAFAIREGDSRSIQRQIGQVDRNNLHEELNMIRSTDLHDGEHKGRIWSTFRKQQIDNPIVPVDSKLETLLESMFSNDKIAVGIHPDQKASIKALKSETMNVHNQKRKQRKRNFIPEFDDDMHATRWPNATVPYYINLNAYAKKENVKKVMKTVEIEFEENTCLKLVQKTLGELKSERNKYINITSVKGDGCNSPVGVPRDEDANELHLEEGGCINVETVLHEFGHAIGMHHEQSRTDRDDHIMIHWDNIAESNHWIFEKEDRTLDNNPYDYDSMMQYGLKYFAVKDWKPTMEFLDPDLEFLADRELEHLRFYDVMDINKAYQCTTGCPDDIICENGGFVNHRCECLCPYGLTGKSCEKIASEVSLNKRQANVYDSVVSQNISNKTADDTCGGIIDLKPGLPVHIKSPNYPNSYDVGTNCYWLLRAESSKQRVMIQVQDFNLSNNKELSRCYHWLEIRYNLVGQQGPLFCGNKFPRNKISSTNFGNPELMMLILDSSTVTGAEASKGFSITAEAFEYNNEGCKDSPPKVDNADNDLDDVGSDIGAIVFYSCDENYHMVGHKSITCEADGTWSDIRFHCDLRDPLFECDFEAGNCGMRDIGYHGHQWNIDLVNGNNFYTVEPKQSSVEAWSVVYLPVPIKTHAGYCLSFLFYRTSSNTKCAALQVGVEVETSSDNTTSYGIWNYKECKESENWEEFKGNVGPVDQFIKLDKNTTQVAKVYLASHTGRDGGEFNFVIDNILISEGGC